MTGLRLHGESDRYHANFYAAQDNLKQVMRNLPDAASRAHAVSNNSGLQNSEKVELVVRERNQPASILSASPLTRYVDYTFEPFSAASCSASRCHRSMRT